MSRNLRSRTMVGIGAAREQHRESLSSTDFEVYYWFCGLLWGGQKLPDSTQRAKLVATIQGTNGVWHCLSYVLELIRIRRENGPQYSVAFIIFSLRVRQRTCRYLSRSLSKL